MTSNINPNNNGTIVPYNTEWSLLYEKEAEKIKAVFTSSLVDIQHIGSTAIPGMSSKPIIDIAILIESSKDANNFIEPLLSLDYEYDKEKSSSERHLFRKYQDHSFHLSIAYKDKGSFWHRQIFFRDYLKEHEEARKEYVDLKFKLLKEDPTGMGSYISGKSEFVAKVLNIENL